MLAAYLAGVVIALNQFKVPPVMQTLLVQLHMDMTTGGWLMSSFAVAGVILGLPAALVFARLGPKAAGLIALGCTLVGSSMGALATSAPMLMAGRVIEGVGLGLITVVAPAVISLWFPPNERGLPMGVWASWVPLGSFVMFNLAGPLLRAFGWQSIWWFGAGLALLAFVIYAAVVSAPPGVAGSHPEAETRLPPGRLLLNPASWILALVFATFTFGGLAYSTWAPTYLNQSLGLLPQTASFDVSLTMLSGLPFMLLAGWILDRTRRRHLVLTLALLASAVLVFWSFQLPGPQAVLPYMALMGVVGGVIPTAVFTLAPETMPRPELAGWALGIVSVGQNLGMFLGPATVAALVAGGVWSNGVLPLVISGALGVMASAWLLFRAGGNQRPAAVAQRAA